MDKSNHLENSPQEKISIGTLLRTEREKKGISKHSLSEIIKVRENNIDALENEEWDKLPARVFIKGFIRSYSLSIGYDTKKALSLFDKCFPVRVEETPKPLVQSTKKSRAIYYFFIILIILAGAIYLLIVRDRVGNPIEEQAVSDKSSSAVTEAVPEVKQADEITPVEATGPTETQEPPIQSAAPPENMLTTSGEPAPAQEDIKIRDGEKIAGTDAAPNQVVIEEQASAPEAGTTAAEPPLMVLSATVNMRTWVKISADDDPPKEYIFQPGSSHKWTATRGFNVTVGNAGGIEFDFNGKTIKDIGEVGMVKNLVFPDNFITEQDE